LAIGVLSDSHGNLYNAEEAVKAIEGMELLLHAGDFVYDAYHLEEKFGCRMLCVAGNCDLYSSEPKEKILEIHDAKILLTHGHLYEVKYGYDAILKRAKQVSAKVVVFGHTHMTENITIDNVLLLNPGSIAFPRSGESGTYAILNIEEGDAEAQIYKIKI
jgi:putative phosphoesterase